MFRIEKDKNVEYEDLNYNRKSNQSKNDYARKIAKNKRKCLYVYGRNIPFDFCDLCSKLRERGSPSGLMGRLVSNDPVCFVCCCCEANSLLRRFAKSIASWPATV